MSDPRHVEFQFALVIAVGEPSKTDEITKPLANQLLPPPNLGNQPAVVRSFKPGSAFNISFHKFT